MSETTRHLELVDLIVQYVRARYEATKRMLILTDSAGTPVDRKPHRIGAFVPDVYAVDVPTTMCVIGEAKSATDLETDHSRQQLEAFELGVMHDTNALEQQLERATFRQRPEHLHAPAEKLRLHFSKLHDV